MLIDFRKDSYRILVEVNSATSVKEAAFVLSKCWQVLAQCKDEKVISELGDSSKVWESLLSLQDACDRLSEATTLLSNELVTLWWAKKPLDPEMRLGNKFGDNSKSKVAVTIGPNDSTLIIETPQLVETHQAKRVKTVKVLSNQEELFESAHRITTELSTIPKETKLSLKCLKTELTASIREELALICSSSSPRRVLKERLQSVPSLRAFADNALIQIGKSKKRSGDDAVEFNG